jgi:hypothetical protein
VVLILVAMALAVLDGPAISRILGKDSEVWGVLAVSLVCAVTLIPGFALSRLAIDIIGIILIAIAIKMMLHEDEIQQLYSRAEKMN